MRSLYEINSEYERLAYECEVFACENGGELPADLDARLEALTTEREQKIRNYALFIKNQKAYAEAIKAEEKKLKQRREAAENLVEKLKTRLTESLGEGEKYKDALLSLHWGSSEACETPDESLVPEPYVHYERKIKRDELKADLKACGENKEALLKFPFAFLSKKKYIVIR